MRIDINVNPLLLDEESPLQLTATTLYGLEDILSEELQQLGATEVEVGRRVVHFKGTKSLLYRANYFCRTALRILMPLISFEAQDPDDLYDQCFRYPWHTILPPQADFFIDTAVFSTIFTNSRYALYRVKDAIRDICAQKGDVAWNATDHRRNAICIHLHINEKRVTLSLDSSGESLHHRGYRVGFALAPLNELLAAGILLKAGYDGSQDLFDPMCGSGTFIAEAAMIASHTPAGYYRDEYAFMRWINFDLDLWKSIRKEAHLSPIDGRIIARDKDFKAIGTTTATLQKMGFRNDVEILMEDFLKASPPSKKPLLIIMNPPYGRRVRTEDLVQLYQAVGRKLKHEYAGSKVWIIASPPALFDKLGLACESKEKIYNGELEAQLRSYQLFEGKKNSYKAQQQKEEALLHAQARTVEKSTVRGTQPRKRTRQRDINIAYASTFSSAPIQERRHTSFRRRGARKIQVFSFEDESKN